MVTVFLTATALLVLVVLVHYEVLTLLTIWLPKVRVPARVRVLLLLFALFPVHVLEIWLFAFGYLGVLHIDGAGHLTGVEHPAALLDVVYFSMVTYTSVGFGDITPAGNIRYMAATEALVGLLLVAWSGSFTFFEMNRFWRQPTGVGESEVPDAEG